ncbi:ABC transporter permease [Flavilitoribacter nigricans]|nr:ABC transporter permease [Flavilitoribacter nigricans]
MLRNYLRVALRNLRKDRLYAGINLFGLSIGIGIAILLLLYVQDEWSFDRFHTKADQIHRAWVKEQVGNELYFNTVTPFILGDKLETDFPEVEAVARYLTLSDLVKNGTLSDEETMHLMSPNFFEVFDFKWIRGNARTFGNDLREVVLTPAIARKYFGTADVVGQKLSLRVGGSWQEFQVGGIIEEAPGNSGIRYDMIIPFENVKSIINERSMQSWTSVFPETYVLFREDVVRSDFEQKLAPYIDQQVARIYEAGDYQVGFQPLTDIHLNNEYPVGYVPVSDGRYPYILSGIALLILVLAGINFVTLALGRSVNRAREVGVRKVSGARRWQLMLQFWSEALLIAGISTVAGVILAEILLPLFNGLADKALDIHYSPLLLLGLVGLTFGIGILAGVYPALVISNYRPMRAIRGTISKLGKDKHVVLRGLVGFQFILSVVLIICTLAMQSQMRYIQNKNLGFDQEQTLVLPYSEAPSNERGLSMVYEDGKRLGELLRNELADESLIRGVSVSSHAFGTTGWTQVGYQEESSQQVKFFQLLNVDEQFLDLSGIDLATGRAFSRDITTDAENAVIINRAMAENLGLSDPVGQAMPKPFEQFQIIGMTDDFNYGTLHSPVEPLVITMNQIGILRLAGDVSYNDTPTAKMNVRINGSEVTAAISTVQEAWQKVAPDQPFDFYFVDEAVGRQYTSERRLSRIISTGSVLAILIACLGLFGIATLTVGQRRKEIGIRKVLGASMLSIFVLLNKRLTIMVAVASLLAAPIAYWLMVQWLNDFEFRVGLSPAWFVLAALISVGIAWLAVSFQSLRAARVNPVDSLKID